MSPAPLRLSSAGPGADRPGQRSASLRNRLFGISLESLRKTPMVIGMCAGKDRAQSVISGVTGGYLKALIIDEIAAMTLLESEETV